MEQVALSIVGLRHVSRLWQSFVNPRIQQWRPNRAEPAKLPKPANALSAEMHNNVGEIQIEISSKSLYFKLKNVVNILQRSIDDGKSQLDLLKVQK